MAESNKTKENITTPPGDIASGDEPLDEAGTVETAETPAVEIVTSGLEGKKSHQKVANFIAPFLRDDLPEFNPGDTIKVHYKIIEGSKERIQVFEGVVISIKHGGLSKTFTVRKVSWNIGVERTFFYHSRKIDKIQLVRRGRVRRAKVYFLRDRIGKAAKIKELRKPKA
jgi:large subunit ribosomal protein L19